MSCYKVSIVMPVYNAGRYLKDAISDILCQTFADFELICVNDGSTDGSLEVLNFFSKKDNRVKVISKDNAGAGAARNDGLEAASGDYIIFLDADDRFSPELIETIYQRAITTSAQIVVCDAMQFDSASGEIYDPAAVGHILRNELVPDKGTFSRNDIPDDIFLFTAMTAWNKLFDLNFLRESDIYFQNVPYFNDAYFAVVLMGLAESVTVINKKLIMYRLGNSSSVSWFGKKSASPQYFFELFLSIKRALVQNNIYEVTRRGLAKLVATNLCGHERIITEENYEVFMKYFEQGFVKDIGLDILEPEDFINDTEYIDISTLVKHGEVAFFARIIHRLVGAADYYKSLSQMDRNVLHKRKKFFSISGVPEDGRIVLYGAGFRGKELFRSNAEVKKYVVTGWLDSNAKDLGEIFGNMISTPEQITEFDYDYVVIAVDKLSVMLEIREKLIGLGVPENRIIW